MGKYEPLRRHLEKLRGPVWEAEFSEIEDVLGFPLPESARRYSAWWANETHGSHSHARSWRNAGWETRKVNTGRGRVRFERAKEPPAPDPSAPAKPAEALWRQAEQISGLTDRDALLQAALTAFVQREAARQLAALGGTMPDLRVPPRERPEG